MQTESTYDPWDDVDARLDLAAAIGELSETEQRIVRMWAEGDTQAEIGEALGIDQATVSRRMNAILAELREKMAGCA